MKNFDLGILFARLGLGVCLFMHGFAKILHGIGGVKSILTKAGLPEIVAYGSYIGEVVAPIMIILGIFSRIGAARYRHESNDNMRPPQTWKFT
jgi:SRC kinase associated phosphoprotein 2